MEECVWVPGAYEKLKHLFSKYDGFCVQNNYNPLGKKKFSAALKCLPPYCFKR